MTKKPPPQAPRKSQIPAPIPTRSKNAHYSYEKIADAMEKSFGHVQVAAKFLGCDRGTLYKAFKLNPELKEIGEQAYNFAVEMGIVHVLQGMAAGNREDFDRVMLYSKKGLAYGFAKRIELTGAEGGPIEVEDHAAILKDFSLRLDRLAAQSGAGARTGSSDNGRAGHA